MLLYAVIIHPGGAQVYLGQLKVCIPPLGSVHKFSSTVRGLRSVEGLEESAINAD